ncbi:MAG: hypothetical protein AB7O88_21590 [Reyranellaceae bacterium]
MNIRIVSHEGGWLSLAAAPTFGAMAFLNAPAGVPDMLCASASPLTGMTAMYLLMSAFHLSPWLKMLRHWRG